MKWKRFSACNFPALCGARRDPCPFILGQCRHKRQYALAHRGCQIKIGLVQNLD